MVKKMKKKIQILMSSYNGEAYIRKQLDSIVNQDTEVSLLIRDDGSSDSTIDIINEYIEKYNFIKLVAGNNLGVIKSFFELFRLADTESDYFALCDQDDIWFPDKMSRAATALDTMSDDKPLLYAAEQTLVDGEDNILSVNMLKVNKRPGFGNSVVENIATGCTCMFNKKMLDLLRSYEPEHTIMHDWWIYMLATSMGEVYYDEKPCMYYRQHGNNTMGSRTNYVEEFKERFSRFFGNNGKLYNQIISFNKAGFDIGEENRQIADMFSGYKKSFAKRVKCIFSKKIYRQRVSDNIIFKLLFFTNHL